LCEQQNTTKNNVGANQANINHGNKIVFADIRGSLLYSFLSHRIIIAKTSMPTKRSTTFRATQACCCEPQQSSSQPAIVSIISKGCQQKKRKFAGLHLRHRRSLARNNKRRVQSQKEGQDNRSGNVRKVIG